MRKIKIISLILIMVCILLATTGCPLFGKSGDDSRQLENPPEVSHYSDDPEAPQGGSSEDGNISALLSDGKYEGEYDANGKFTGWGVWVYHNYRYEGYFVDGVPNGEGTVIISGIGECIEVFKGVFVNGYAHGEILYEIHFDVLSSYYNFSLDHGRLDPSIVEVKATHFISRRREDRESNVRHINIGFVYGVPPWVHNNTDPSLPAPTGNEPYLQGSTLTPNGGDGQILPPDSGDNSVGGPLALPAPFETHPGDAEYFYEPTDNYIVALGEGAMSAPCYIAYFFDDDDILIRKVEKGIFESEAVARDVYTMWALMPGGTKDRVENVVYVSDPFEGRTVSKSECLSMIDESSAYYKFVEVYISRP